jgi:alpha-mannosidase
MARKYTAHVVSHTHWDREWYKTFQHYRMRLVDLTDTLIDLLETNPDFRYFTFDGQTIVLEDYLQIRPENEERLRKLIREGRILIGPWYNQPDEFLVSGECIIRNLLVGRRLCKDFGNYMAVGYVPDAFGHISQFPQIMRGFGIDNAVLFRGITTDQTDSEFIWRSPDGSEVLCVKMPDNNAYSNWFYRLRESLRYPDRPVDADQAVEEVRALVEDCVSEKPTTSQLLFMDGCDHVFPQFKTPEIIAIANDRLDNVEVRHSTLPTFIEAVRSERPNLKTITGELRWSNRAWKLQTLLTNVLSSRVHLKQMNHECETLLERYVEPLCSWVWWLGGEYPGAYIDLAWNYLLKNSPHDSICGCSIDQVHKDMVYRYDQTKQIGERLLDKALAELAAHIGSEAPNPEKTALAVVFNPLSHKRTDVVEAEIDLPGEWQVPGVRVLDPEGEEIPHSILGFSHYGTMEPDPYDIPLGTHRQKMRIAFLGTDVPSVGYKAYRIEVLDRPNRRSGSLLLGPDTAENEFLSVTVLSDGTFSLLDKETDAVYTTCLVFEDGGDIGDGYNYVKPLKDTVVTSLGAKCQVSVVEDSPVRAVFEIATDMELPASIHPNRTERSADTVTCRIRTYLTLAAGVKRLDIRTVFDNRAKDHRLRVLFPTGIPARVSYAESTFDVVERPIEVPECPDWREPMPAMHPQRSFVDVSGGGVGLTVANKALWEYEVKDDEARTVALTLLRATGSGVCGPELQKGGQLPGEHVFEYALYPHAGDWEEAMSWRQAHAFNAPLIVGQTGIHGGDLPMKASLVAVFGDRFVMTALKKSDAGDSLLVRGFNIGTEPENVRLSVPGLAVCEQVDLKEDALGTVDVEGEAVGVSVDPRRIVAYRLTPV